MTPTTAFVIGMGAGSVLSVAALFVASLCIVSADADRALELATDEDPQEYERAEANVVPIERGRTARGVL